jgi:chromate transporter
MVVVLAPWITRYRRHPAVQGFTRGATSAAAGAIVGAAAIIATQVLVDLPTVAIALVAFAVLWRTKVPEPAIVAGAALVGLAAVAVRGV